tara:strand:- start:145 stop:768 length:624 start_codon:yes stop_codon:yes gene_type:complete
MSRDVINIDSIRLTTELNKFRRNKVIPSSFLDGTFTILDLKDNYNDFSAKHKKLADKLIDVYNVELRQSADGLQKSLLNEYRGFVRNQYTRQEHWSYPAVMKNYRANINPVRAIYYEVKEMIKRYNDHDEHHGWLLDIVTSNEWHHRIMKDIIGDRKKVDKIINFYSPLYEAGNIPLPIEITHLKTLRSDLLDYANLFTKVKTWRPR